MAPLMAPGKLNRKDVIDYFIPQNLLQGYDSRGRARVLVGLLLVYFFTLFICLIYIAFLSPFAGNVLVTGEVILTISLVCFCGLLFYFNRSGEFHQTCQLTTFTILLIVSSGVFFTGGIEQSSITPLFVIAPAVSLILLGHRGFVQWVILSLSVFAVFVALRYLGYAFPQNVDPAHEFETRIFVFVFGYAATLCIVLVYEATTQRLAGERDIEQARFEYFATHDELTMLPNRSRFKSVLENTVLYKSRRIPGDKVALIFIDLDGFKPINDTYGHQAGDKVLIETGLRLRSCIRVSDIVARQGGDEFTIMLDHIQKEEDLAAIAEKIIQCLSEPITFKNSQVAVSASLGIALFPDHTDQLDKLWHCADSAMYYCKKHKKGWVVYQPSQDNILN